MALLRTNKQKRLAVAAVLLAGAWLAQQAGIDVSSLIEGSEQARPPATSAVAPSAPRADHVPIDARTSDADQRVARAIAKRESGFMVTVDARVEKRLPDDRDGSRHQRFLIELDSGQTLLVAHNIDLAERIPISEGSRVRVRG